MTRVAAYLGLGSNLGDRLAMLQAAVDGLDRRAGIEVRRSSRVYETEAIGPPQPHFLNAVVEVETMLTPSDLLLACLAVEEALGRTRDVRWGPRTIDIDILTYARDHVREDDPPLEVPHPRMHERLFVLAPLLELEADPPLPGERRLASLRLDGGELAAVRPVAPGLAVGTHAR